MRNTDHLKVGVSGENIVSSYLKKNGYNILGRNVRYKAGELDIVSSKDDVLHFIEVKTVHVIRETQVLAVMPEDNLHFGKIKRLKRAIQMYAMENAIDLEEVHWQFDLYTVVIRETPEKKAIIRKYENLVI